MTIIGGDRANHPDWRVVRVVTVVGVCSALANTPTCQIRQKDVRDAQGEVLSVLARLSGVCMVRVESRLLAVATLFAPDLIAAMLSGYHMRQEVSV
jgi:hypothetical protein